MAKDIKNSVVADNHSTITNSSNKTVKKIDKTSLFYGFLIGVASSLLANYIYTLFVK